MSDESDHGAAEPHQVDKKRKEAPVTTEEDNKKQKLQENRAIYVTNIPRDATHEEVEEVFKRFGIIDVGLDGRKRVKLYEDDQGNFNGEALILYFRQESVTLAINMMDDYQFRLGDYSHGNIQVQEADMSYKRNKDKDFIDSQMARKDRKETERKNAEMYRKLADWSDNEEEVAKLFAPKQNKWAHYAIIKHAFDLKELEDDPAAIMDIKEEILEEAEEIGGAVTKIVLYDKEPEGVVTIRFTEPEFAQKFTEACNKRKFARRVLEVTVAENRPKFKKSRKADIEPDTDED